MRKTCPLVFPSSCLNRCTCGEMVAMSSATKKTVKPGTNKSFMCHSCGCDIGESTPYHGSGERPDRIYCHADGSNCKAKVPKREDNSSCGLCEEVSPTIYATGNMGQYFTVRNVLLRQRAALLDHCRWQLRLRQCRLTAPRVVRRSTFRSGATVVHVACCVDRRWNFFAQTAWRIIFSLGNLGFAVGALCMTINTIRSFARAVVGGRFAYITATAIAEKKKKKREMDCKPSAPDTPRPHLKKARLSADGGSSPNAAGFSNDGAGSSPNTSWRESLLFFGSLLRACVFCVYTIFFFYVRFFSREVH